MVDARLQAARPANLQGMLSPTTTRMFGARFWQVRVSLASTHGTFSRSLHKSTILTAHTKSLRSPQSQNANTTHIQSLPLGRRRLERLHEELHALLLLLIALRRVERHEIL